ncbi:ATP-binding protein [Actinoallomurus sp. CA-142502]|uniref:ATP-binding protein n=1 Tax=Actinoallomurus sp. CA-142502 TaxID=3239885 RepID=UPI003D8CDF15
MVTLRMELPYTAMRHRQPMPEETGDQVDEMHFTVDHLPGVRRFVAAHARKCGLDEESVGDLVIAVNEIATNGVRHGSPKAELRMWASNGRVYAEVRDQGHWVPSDAGDAPPSSDAEGGMGLWVTRQICSAVHIIAGERGTTVRLEMPLPPRYA